MGAGNQRERAGGCGETDLAFFWVETGHSPEEKGDSSKGGWCKGSSDQ